MVRRNHDEDVRMDLGEGIQWELQPNGFCFNEGDAAKVAILRAELLKKKLDPTIYCQIHNGCLYYTPADPGYSPGPIKSILLS